MLIQPRGGGATYVPPPGLLAGRSSTSDRLLWLPSKPRIVRKRHFEGATDQRGRLIIPLEAAIAVVQTPSIYTWDASASGTRAFGSNTTAGNAIFVTLGGFNGGGNAANPTSITDTQGNTFTRDVTMIGSSTLGLQRIDFIASAPNIAGGADTITVTFPTSNYYARGIVTEVSGLAISSMLDGTPGTNTATSTSATASTTTSAPDTIVIGHMAAIVAATRTLTPAVGWTQLGEFETGGSGPPFNAVYGLQSGAGTYTPTWTINTSTEWQAVCAAYKASAAAAVGGSLYRRRSSLICR
jgi:hypothetical protein